MLKKTLIAILLTIPFFAWSQTKYTVREGDTLLKIADKNLEKSEQKISRYEFVKNLIKLNPDLKNPNALTPGQTILLPAEAAEKANSLKPVAEAALAIAANPVPPVATPAPTPTTTPIPTPAQTPPQVMPSAIEPHASETTHHNFIFVQPRYQIVKLEAKDEAAGIEATMNSNSSIGLDLQYGFILNDRWHLLFQAGVTNTQFGDIKDHVGTVNHKSEILKTFAAGVAYEVTPTLHMDLLALYTEQSFLLPHTATEYMLEAIAFPGAELDISWDFYSGAKNIFGVSAIGEYLSSVTKDGIKYDSVTEPYGALYWKSNYGHDSVNYKVTLTYKHGHQETSVAKKIEDLSVLGVGFYF